MVDNLYLKFVSLYTKHVGPLVCPGRKTVVDWMFGRKYVSPLLTIQKVRVSRYADLTVLMLDRNFDWNKNESVFYEPQQEVSEVYDH